MAVVFLLAAGIALQNVGVDNHCRSDLSAPAVYPDDAKTAEDFLKRGDAAFDKGSCKEAIAVYTQALALNPDYAQAYNNRAYTYMRMRDYAPALQDLDQALRIRPDYLHALMNRGDIHNYYFEQDRKKAIEDYDHILHLGGQAHEISLGDKRGASHAVAGFEFFGVKCRCGSASFD